MRLNQLMQKFSVGAASTTIINKGTLSATGDTVNMKVASGVNKITNSGTIDTATQADDARGCS